MRLSVNVPNSASSAMAAAATAALELEEGEPLSPAAMLFRQPQFNYNIIYILGFGKILTIKEIKAGLQVTLLRHPRFCSIQLVDKSSRQKLRWVPTKVNLDEHIVLADPGPKAAAAASDPTVGDLYVENYTAGLCNSPLDYSRPPWELHILAIRTSEVACVAIFRLSHSIGDGISLMSLLHACTRRTSDPESLPSLPKTRRRSTDVAARFGPFTFLCWIWTFLIYVWNTLVEVILFVSTTICLKDTKILNVGKEGINYRPRRIVHRTLCLDDIIAIKNTIGCTINDVLVGATSAALSRYLSRKYGGLLPKHLRIRTAMIVNVRRISGINDLAYMMKEDSDAKWGNRFGFFLLRLPVIKCEDPLDYARNVAANTEKKKKSWAAILSYKSFVLISKCLGTKVATVFFERFTSNVTLSFSNVIGPMEEVSFCGSPIIYLAPSVSGHREPVQFQEDGPLADPTTYRRITGALQYLIITRPDIAHAVNTLSQHMHNPESIHIYLLKRLLRYLKGTITFGLPITKSALTLRTYSDADWAGDPVTRKSTTGYCTFLGDTLVSWAVKKQTTVSRSSTESEYRALAAATADTIWLKRLLADFNIPHEDPIELFCDNTSAIALANNPVFHARTKHIEIDHRFVRDQLLTNNIRLLPISTIDQIADILTKSLPTARFKTLRTKLTILPDSSVCRGMLEQNSS